MSHPSFLQKVDLKSAGKPNRKYRVLFYGDSPTCATGFGQVSRNILPALHESGKFDIGVLGINYWGDPHEYPFPIWPMAINNHGDPYGRGRLLQHLADPNLDFDILFFMQDSFILQMPARGEPPYEGLPKLLDTLRKMGKKFASVCYFPVDGIPKKSWIEAMSSVDCPVTFTQFAKEQAIKAVPSIEERLRIIPHGVNPEVFKPIPREQAMEFRKRYLGINEDKFVITNVNRNQQRKDIPATIRAFVEFRKHRPNSLLYLHMAAYDQGWNLPEVIRAFGMDMSKDIVLPQNFTPSSGFPLEILNVIYNMSDVVLSTTVGEGWGLSWSEAMACRVPVVFPMNTCLGEYITEETGFPYKSGGDPDHITVLPNDNEVLRPTAHISDLVEKLISAHDNREEAARRANNAYEMVTKNLIWTKHITPMWVSLLDEVASTKQRNMLLQKDYAKPVMRGEVL